MKHANIPLFIPHMGCPYNCVFCDQKSISGKNAFDLEKAHATVEQSIRALGGRPAELAFFGGSFTAIPEELMIALLEMARFHVRKGELIGIRLSTRPDCVSEKILDILEQYKVTSIELGIQSMNDGVLLACGRGHNSCDTIDACQRVKRRKCFSLAGQMMLGLPQSDFEKELYTARVICALGVDSCRIYPTVVLRGTGLERLLLEGKYLPLTLEEGIRRGAEILKIFEENNIKVLRMGLCAEESCEASAVAGCYHPSYGELVNSRLFLEAFEEYFKNQPPEKDREYTVFVAPGRLSAAIGHKKVNKEKLSERYGCRLFFAEKADLKGRQFVIEKGNNRALKIIGASGIQIFPRPHENQF